MVIGTMSQVLSLICSTGSCWMQAEREFRRQAVLHLRLIFSLPSVGKLLLSVQRSVCFACPIAQN